MKIAVVGAGVAGLVSAHLLARSHEVVLFEAESRLGGHSNTVDVDAAGGPIAIDTGFIVFNTRTYPNFVRWLRTLGVRWQSSDMSFSVRSDRRDFEYGSAGLNALFAQRKNLLRPAFHRMWLDILRFYRDARMLLATGAEIRLEDFLRDRGYSAAFVTDHLLPLVGAVWSSNRDGAREFPARLLVRFFDHHGFLQSGAGWTWLTITGGSREYVRAMEASFSGTIRLSSRVASLARTDTGIMLGVDGRAPEAFDHVVMACHADDALGTLSSPTPLESDLLGTFRFQRNAVVLHTDERLMPTRHRAWASWNYHLDDERSDGACVTYWMNRLQSIAGPTNYFVTLNHRNAIRPERILREFSYSHPFFTPAAADAQARHHELVSHQGVSYCGAYWRNGFHEDGVVSALRVCEALGVAP